MLFVHVLVVRFKYFINTFQLYKLWANSKLKTVLIIYIVVESRIAAVNTNVMSGAQTTLETALYLTVASISHVTIGN